jgi:transposase-like protein
MSSKGEDETDLTVEEARILSTLAEKGLNTTRPIQSGGNLVYEGLDEIAKELPEKNIRKYLKSLLDKGYLKESDHQTILSCPSCDSVNILPSQCCPYCQSRKVRKTKLAEHKLCGYIGSLDDFDQVDGYLCPKCKTQITKINSDPTTKPDAEAEMLRVIGSSFVCDTCGAKFEKPSIIYTCSDCESNFTNKKANHVQIPAYEVVKKLELETLRPIISPRPTEQKVEENTQAAEITHEPEIKPPLVTANEAIKRIESAFRKRGFTFQYGYKLRGKSGFEQSFDAAAKKGEQTVLIDVSQTGDQADLIGLVGKKKDVDVRSIILLDITGNSDHMSLGKQYAITVIDGRSGDYSKTIAEILSDAGED